MGVDYWSEETAWVYNFNNGNKGVNVNKVMEMGKVLSNCANTGTNFGNIEHFQIFLHTTHKTSINGAYNIFTTENALPSVTIKGISLT